MLELEGTLEELLARHPLVLAYYYAEWCGPCRALQPTLQAVARAFQDQVTIIKINVDLHLALVTEVKIMGVPTFILYHHGKPVWRQADVMRQQELEQLLLQYGVSKQP